MLVSPNLVAFLNYLINSLPLDMGILNASRSTHIYHTQDLSFLSLNLNVFSGSQLA